MLLIAVGIAFALLPKEWIEGTLGFEPDGGSGALELGLALVPICLGVALLALRYLLWSAPASAAVTEERRRR